MPGAKLLEVRSPRAGSGAETLRGCLASAVTMRRGAVERAGRAFRLRDSVGLRHLAQLLAEPGRERHALDLAGPGGAAPHETGSGGRLLDDRARAGTACASWQGRSSKPNPGRPGARRERPP